MRRNPSDEIAGWTEHDEDAAVARRRRTDAVVDANAAGAPGLQRRGRRNNSRVAAAAESRGFLLTPRVSFLSTAEHCCR